MSLAVFVACFAVAVVLVIGLYSMYRGGAFNQKWGNKLMQMRVALQAVAIAVIMLAVLMSGR